jgi:uncharacterized protein with von Willebrand factor type A (vWA) domain
LHIREKLGSELGTLIAYSEVAHVTSIEEATIEGPDYVYGSNLQHALVLARAASQATGESRIVLVTYSLPSAHHISGEPVLMEPPIPESLDAARTESERCARDCITIDVLLVVPDLDSERTASLQTFFVPMSESTGGTTTLVRPGDRIETVVERTF